MSYYPKSQIKPNLYTDGTQYATPNGVPYTGFYFETSTGELFTGRTPQDLPNIRLVPLFENQGGQETTNLQNQFYQVKGALDPSNPDPEIDPKYLDSVYIYNQYTALTGTPKSSFLPYYLPNIPTDEDYSIGEFRRYFCKKTNEIKYIEINEDQYDMLVEQNPQILWQLYTPFYLNWEISGDKQKVAQTNKNIVELTSQRKKLPRLGDYLKNDYIKYYK